MNELEQRKREFELETLNFKKDQSDLVTQKYKYTEMIQTLERDLSLVQKERGVAERELRDAREYYNKAGKWNL